MDEPKLHTELMRTIHHFQRFNMNAVFGGISRGEFFALTVLVRQAEEKNSPWVYVSELAEKLEVSTPGVSRMLRHMEGEGWIERVTERSDRRNTRVLITPKGVAAQEKTSAAFHAFSDNVVAQMSVEELSQLLMLWNRLLDAMECECENIKKRTDETDA